MKRFPLALLALAVALAITPAALADSFNYTYTDGTLTATGTLSGNLVAPGEYDITSGTISITGGGAVQGSGGFLALEPKRSRWYYHKHNPRRRWYVSYIRRPAVHGF